MLLQGTRPYDLGRLIACRTICAAMLGRLLRVTTLVMLSTGRLALPRWRLL